MTGVTAMTSRTDDVTVPPAPAELRQWVQERSHDAAVVIQPDDGHLDWWNDRLDGMPGAPASTRRGEVSGEASSGTATSTPSRTMPWTTTPVPVRSGCSGTPWRGARTCTEAAPTVRSGACGSPRTRGTSSETPPGWPRRTPGRPSASCSPTRVTTRSGRPGPRRSRGTYFAGAGRWDHPYLIVNRAVLATLREHTRLKRGRTTTPIPTSRQSP